MSDLLELKKELRGVADKKRARVSQGFFKTGKGEYGEGDVFIGLTVPQSRKIAIKFKSLKFSEILDLLKSKIHEERLIALLILVHKFNVKDYHTNILENIRMRKGIFDFYIRNAKLVNNWDLVDLSADKIVGGYLFSSLGSTHSLNDSSKPSGNTRITEENKSFSPAANKSKFHLGKTVKSSFRKESRPFFVLLKLARSKNLWERRIAIVATFQFIKNGKFDATLKIAEILLNDKHDLIQKAVGWMLREVGKRDLKMEIKFLNKHYKKMPRVMLRYAIERFPEKLRMDYLNLR